MIIDKCYKKQTITKYFLFPVALITMTSCSLFEPAVQNCDEAQEYQESYSIPDLVIPETLREIQKRSSFYIPEIAELKSPISEEYLPVLKEELESKVESEEQISGDQLSELLDLIDRTIDGRDNAIEGQTYKQKSSIKPTKSSTGECLDVSPNYFADGVLKTNRPSQLSERSQAESDEKGWWQRMRDRRKNREEENNP